METHLQLRTSLAKFLAASGLRWGRHVSQNMFAKATGLSPTTVSKLAHDVLDAIDRETVGLLCAYFWCQPGEILTLRDELDEQRILAAVRRPHLPDVVEPLPVISHIRTKLEQAPERANQLTIKRTTGWRLRKNDPARFSSETLIALAVAFNTTNINDFLTVEFPASQPPEA